MTAENLVASLQFWRDHQLVQPAGIWERLVIAPEDSIRIQTEPIARIDIIAIGLSYHESDEDPPARFVDDLQNRLVRTGQWLSRQSPDVFADARRVGCSVRLVFVLWADEDGFDLHLPSSLLKACGNLHIGLAIQTKNG